MEEAWSIIILAAGKGTRMGGDVPKPLVLLGGKPLIEPILHNALEIPFQERVIVISDYTQEVRLRYPDVCFIYCHTEPRGTGAAVQEALRYVTTPFVVIAQADDSYFYSQHSLRRLMAEHQEAHADFTVAVTQVQEALPYAFVTFDDSLRLLEVRKSAEDLQAPPPKYVVTGLYAAQVDWLQRELESVPVSAKGEVPLPGVIDRSLGTEVNLRVFVLPPDEWSGVNTPEELRSAERRLS